MGRDIDPDSREWLPIGGNNPTDATGKFFEGSFDGQGYSVSNIRISTGYHHVGFFGDVKNATILDLGIESGSILGESRVGGIAGAIRNGVTIRGCYNKVAVCGRTFMGGIVGMIGGKDCLVTSRYNTGEIFARSKQSKTAGLLGYLAADAHHTKLLNSYNQGNYFGLIGSVHASATGATIENCYSASTLRLVRIQEALTTTGSFRISTDTLKTYAPVLGDTYTEDTALVNRGYPILFRQQEGHRFHSYMLTSKDADTHSACCRYCTDSYTEAHSFTDGVCICGEEETKAPVVDEEIVINHTLNLASDISLNFAVLSSLLDGYESHYLEVRIPVYQGNALIGTRTVTIEPVVKGSSDYYTLTGLTAAPV